MRNGMKVASADTHITVSEEDLTPYFLSAIRELVPNLDQSKVSIFADAAGHTLEPSYPHRYRLTSVGAGCSEDVPRMLGEAAPREGSQRRRQKFMGTKLPTRDGERVSESRIRDMNEEEGGRPGHGAWSSPGS